MADPVAELKKKMLTKMREAGLPEIAEQAVDFLTPDDLEDVGMTAAAAMIPGGAAVKMGSTAVKAGKKLTGMAAKIAKDKELHRAAMKGLEKSGQEASKNLDTIITGAGIGVLPLTAGAVDGSETDEKIKELVRKRQERKKDELEKKRSMVMGVRG